MNVRIYKYYKFLRESAITAGGIGGMVMFNNEEYYKRALMFRDWGELVTHRRTIGKV